MRVFVAGATGLIGSRAVEMLSARGHEVCALTRNQDAADWLRDMGAEVCVADALDAELMRGGVAGTEPDVILHQLSALPRRFDPDRVDERFADNDRIRIEGTRNLIGAARAARVRRLVAQSIAFGYAPDGERVKREDAPLFLDAPGYFGKTVAAVAELERQVLGADGIDGLVLRYGYLHGDGTAYADDGQTADSVRAGELPIVEGGEGLWSFTHVEDAAAAAVAAVEGGAPGAYNVVDDDPVAARDWLPLYARALGAPRPPELARQEALERAGWTAVHRMADQPGAANGRARDGLDWAPRHESFRAELERRLGDL